MATLSRDKKRAERARKHAKYAWACPKCGKTCKGNGGKSKPQAMAPTANTTCSRWWSQLNNHDG